MSKVEIEVRATRTVDNEVEWCHEDEAEEFSVYVGTAGAFRCISDWSDSTGALAEAARLSQDWGVPYYDRIERGLVVEGYEIDPTESRLSGAYVVLGFHRAASNQCWEIAAQGAEIELVRTLSDLGIEVERVFMEVGDGRDEPGVWHYEVAEPFGAWLAQQVAANGELPDAKDAMRELRKMAREFFAQGE